MIWHVMIYDMIWYDMIWYDMIWYDMLCYDMTYLLTAVGLTPGGSSTVHIYTQTVHRTVQYCRIHTTFITMKIHKHKNKNKIFNFVLF